MWLIDRKMELRFWLERSNVTNTPINWINEDLEHRFERKLFIQGFCGFPKCTDNGKGGRLPCLI